ncbi:hypothetical protein Tco_0701849 [Tanacetum coccineum]|uniref:Uncharacterized protein n=1 Tax=Tanacetum coccineum TaxID=301880 RepID=A0ABQ4XVU5_9ASTR
MSGEQPTQAPSSEITHNHLGPIQVEDLTQTEEGQQTLENEVYRTVSTVPLCKLVDAIKRAVSLNTSSISLSLSALTVETTLDVVEDASTQVDDSGVEFSPEGDDYFPTIGDEIEKKMFPLAPGPYYMPCPYADGESGVPPKYTIEEWDQPHVPYANLLNKEIFKDPNGLYIYSRPYHDSDDVRHLGHLPCPTPLPESPTQELVNTSHQTPLTSGEASQRCLHLLTECDLDNAMEMRSKILGTSSPQGVLEVVGEDIEAIENVIEDKPHFFTKAKVVVEMVGEEVPWPEEAVVDWPSVQLIRTTVKDEEDWWFLEVDLQGSQRSGEEVNRGGVDLGVVNSLLGEIPRDVTGESGGETFGVDG